MKTKHLLILATILTAISFGMAIHVAKEKAKVSTQSFSGVTHAKK